MLESRPTHESSNLKVIATLLLLVASVQNSIAWTSVNPNFFDTGLVHDLVYRRSYSVDDTNLDAPWLEQCEALVDRVLRENAAC